MDQRINHLHDPAFSNVRMPITPVEKRLSTALKQLLASKWGLDKLYRWKLSREFAKHIPSLTVVLVSSVHNAEFENTESEHTANHLCFSDYILSSICS